MDELIRIVESLPGWAVVIIGLAFAVALGLLVRWLFVRVIDRGDADRHRGRQAGRLVGLVVFAVLSINVLQIAGISVGPMLGALGVGGIAVAFAAQDILANLLAGLMIQIRRPFRIGEQVETMGYEGTVRDIDLRATRLHTFDGLDVILPNAKVLAEPITNHTRTPLRRTTLEVGVAYSTDLRLAATVLARAVHRASAVADRPAPQVWLTQFSDSSIVFAVRFWHGSTQRELWEARHHVGMAVKEELDRSGIEIPFPQRTLWFPAGLGGSAGQPENAHEDRR